MGTEQLGCRLLAEVVLEAIGLGGVYNVDIDSICF